MKLRVNLKSGAAFAAMLLLASCGSFDGRRDGMGGLPPVGDTVPDMGASSTRVSDTPVKLGAPYQVGGETFTPVDVVDYDDVGYASWYGRELEGRTTANGELFNPDGISAAHRTLPLPSYVEVTALDTGKTILVRVNDRGPFDRGRLIDLSEAAARQLGITAQGQAPVRVRRVNPPESERAALRAGRAIPDRLATPDSLLAVLRSKLGGMGPAPIRTIDPGRGDGAAPPPARASGEGRFIVEEGGARPAAGARPTAPASTAENGYVVQIGAFLDRRRAEAMARQAGAAAVNAGSVWRVRYGPFASEAEAQKALATARAKGYAAARISRAP